MSDGTDVTSLVIGSVATGGVALGYAFVKGLFNRGVKAHDDQLTAERAAWVAARDEMRTDVKNILAELRSMHDEQTRQRGEITALGKEIATVAASAKAAHDRIDALVTTPPKRGHR